MTPLSFLVLSSFAATAAAEVTKWTDATGSFTVEAEFVRIDGQTVILKQTGGDELEIPLDKLSTADQKRAKGLASAASSPFKSRSSSPFKSRGSSDGPMKESSEVADDDAPSVRSGSVQQITLRGQADERLQPDEVDANWSIEPDGVETELELPKSGLRFRSAMGLHDSVKGVVIDRAAGRAVVAAAIHKFSDPAEGSLLTVIDLTKGEAQKPVRVEGTQIPHTLTMDGTRLSMGNTSFGFGKSTKMTVYDVGPRTIEPLWTADPFTDLKAGGEQDIAYSMVLSEDRALAVNSRGLTRIFETPSGKVVYEAELGDWEARPTLSPGGKYLLLPGELQVAAYDVETLDPVAAVETPSGMNPVVARLSTDGTLLMCVGRQTLAVYDTANGELLGDTLHGAGIRDLESSLAHAGEGFYFVGPRLVDIDSHVPVWDYHSAKAATDFGGETLLFYDRVPGQHDSSLAVAGKLPHKAPRTTLEEALAEPDLFALKPGDTVTLDLAAVSNKTGVDEAKRQLTQWAEEAGITIGTGGDKKLVATMRQGEEETREYRSMGFGRGGTETVRYRPQVATMRLMVDGREAWSLERSSGGPSFMLNMKQGESAQQAANRQTQTDARMLGGMHPPAYVLNPKYGSGTLGSSTLGTRGLVDQRSGTQ